MKLFFKQSWLRSPFPLLFILFFLTQGPRFALADQGDLSVGVTSSVGKPEVGSQLRTHLAGVARLGLSDWLELESTLGTCYQGGPGLEGGLGIVLMADIIQWVPELALAGMADLRADSNGDYRVVGGLRAELRARYFLSMKGALSLGGGALWMDNQLMPIVTINWLYLLD